MIPYVEPGTHLFRFMDPRTDHFWSAIADLLVEQKLFLNSRTKFNDPYDSQPTIEDDLSNSIIRAHLQEMLENPWNPRRDSLSVARILQLKAQGKTRLNRKQIENIKVGTRRNAAEYLDLCGLASFSLVANHKLLWAHYAAGASGVCIVFKRGASMTSGFSVCAKVSYTDERPRLPLSLLYQMASARMTGESYDDVAEKILLVSFLFKSKEWEYEQEARIFYPFHASKKIGFEPSELIAIILGPNAHPDLEKKLKNLLRQLASPVVVHKALLSKSRFGIELPDYFTNVAATAA